MDAVSSQPVSPNVLRAPARAGDQTCAKGIEVRSKSVSAKRNSRSLTHALFKRVLRSEIAQRGCVGPDATPHDLGDNPIRSEFNYTLENGQRTKLEETFYFDHDGDGSQTTPDVAKTTTYDWVYDANDRLLSETIDHHDNALDRTESFVMDLFGNRTARTIDYHSTPAPVDEAFAYLYDDNDRLITETLDEGNDSSIDQTTRYSWDSTQQTAKEVFTGDSTNPADLVSSQTFNYDLQGRLAEVVNTPETGNSTKITYEYDSAGIRGSSTQFTDANNNGQFESSELDHTVEYLVDHRNHTGYTQTIVETTKDSAGQVVKRVATTFGTDEVTQTVTDYVAGVAQTPVVHTFGHNAHGSVRVLLDVLGAIAQTYTYAAHGKLLAIYDVSGKPVGTLGKAATAAALTSLLYSGESFDSRIGQQYLRARWYDSAAGRFSRLDPYFGTLNDPLSFNKFNYVHSSPISGVDPTGRNFTSTSISATTSIGLSIGATALVLKPIFNSAHALAQTRALTELATRLKTKVLDRTQVKKQTNNGKFMYFVHGSTTGSWLAASNFSLSVNKRPLDFGLGFYTRLANAAGIKEVSEWANTKSRFDGGTPFVLLLGVKHSRWNQLSKKSYGAPHAPTPDFEPDVNAYRNGIKQFSGHNVVFGPTARYNGLSWVANKRISNQYKFEPSAFPDITLVGIFPAFPNVYTA